MTSCAQTDWGNNLLITSKLNYDLIMFVCKHIIYYVCFYFQEYFEHGETEDVVVSS